MGKKCFLDKISITFLTSTVTSKPSELPSTPANASNKVLTTPLKAGTQNETPTSMTPNTRKQKSRLLIQLTSYIQEMNLNHEDQHDTVILSLKQLNCLMHSVSLENPQRQVGR